MPIINELQKVGILGFLNVRIAKVVSFLNLFYIIVFNYADNKSHNFKTF